MAEIAGIFAVSHTPVMTNLPHAPAEEVARTVHIARQLGTPLPIPQCDIDSL